jgi:hypothetical protein
MIFRIIKSLKLRLKLLWNYINIKQLAGKRSSIEGSFVHFDLKDLGLESYYCYLILSFLENGYSVSIGDNVWFIANCRSHMRQLIINNNIPIIKRTKGLSISGTFLIYDLETNLKGLSWKKIIHVNLNIYQAKNKIHLSMPYQMSPHIYLSDSHHSVIDFRNQLRSMKIFFSGNQDPQAYGSMIYRLFFDKMNRLEILAQIRSELKETQLSSEVPSKDQRYLNKMVLLDWSWSPEASRNLNKRIDNHDWLSQIAQSHFFLCPPGIRTPFCHHTIESMSVGTIPILEYPELFDPPLIHMKNAICFSGPKDLVEKIELVLSLDVSVILEMSKLVADYYDDFLQLSRTPTQIINADSDRLELYINGEEKSYTQAMRELLN